MATPGVNGFCELVANEPTEMGRRGLWRSDSVFVSGSPSFSEVPVQVSAKKLLRYMLTKKARVAHKNIFLADVG